MKLLGVIDRHAASPLAAINLDKAIPLGTPLERMIRDETTALFDFLGYAVANENMRDLA
jgi:hypothetical protein